MTGCRAVGVWAASPESDSDSDLGGLGGSQDALEAAETEVMSGGEPSGGRARQVCVDDGKAFGVAESVGEAPSLLRDWPAYRSSARGRVLWAKVQVSGLRRVRVSGKHLH
jgi:hypothetical protein